jgi:tetratricopeptide (TPR) repeat protein
MRFVLYLVTALLFICCSVQWGEAKTKTSAPKKPEQKPVSIDILDKNSKKLASEKGLIGPKGIVATKCSLVIKYLKEPESILQITTDDGKLLGLGKILFCNLKKDNTSFHTKPFEAVEGVGAAQPTLQGEEEKRIEEAHNEHDWVKKGLDHLRSKNFARAENAFKQALRLKPDFYEAYINLGNVYFIIGNYFDAIESYNYALKNIGFKDVLYNKIGTSYLILGDYNKAIEAYKQAIHSGQTKPQTHFSLGLLFYLNGDNEEAFNEYVNLNKIDKELAESLFDLLYR